MSTVVLRHSSTLVFVGGGPRTVGLLERFAASAPELLDGPVQIHIVDPHPAGGGRIWRRNQSPLLWMNSMASDVTIFTDDSVVCDGPIVPGPDLAEWAAGPGAAFLERSRLSAGPMEFPSRLVQAEYLAWAFKRVLRSLPARVHVTVHEDRAVAIADDRVVLASGNELYADVVVLALGYLDRSPSLDEASFEGEGLVYIGPGYTADVDLSSLRAGEPVIVRGLGQAFIDLMVLLSEGRGGRYSQVDGLLTYHPSGAEPILYVGSRRGVPYHAKLGYTVAGTKPVPTRFFTIDAFAELGVLEYLADVKPLVDKELVAAHYTRLFAAHPERTAWPWERFDEVLERTLPSAPEFVAAVEAAVPAPADRFVVASVDRPLEGMAFADRDGLSTTIVRLIEEDLLRRADPTYSADLAVFNALLSVYSVLSVLITDGRLSDEDRVRHIETDWHGFFSFVASGPPPERLEQLLALHRAGVVRFAGPDLSVEASSRGFVGTSPALAVPVVARSFVEARLPRPDVLAATDPLVRGLLATGQVAADHLVAADGTSLGGGQLKADGDCRAIRADGSVHPSLFMLGPSVSGSAGSSGFSRPHFNGPGFRQNDRVARHLLKLLSSLSAQNSPRVVAS